MRIPIRPGTMTTVFGITTLVIGAEAVLAQQVDPRTRLDEEAVRHIDFDGLDAPDPAATLVPAGETLVLGPAAVTTVLPPAAEGVEGINSEGTSLGFFSNTAQIVYGADLLAEAGLLTGDRINGLAFRVDVAFGAPVWSVADYQVRLATSLNPPGALDTNFVNNRGSDYTVVRAGALTYDGSEYPTGGNPNGFGEVIAFQTAFIYRGGDLLLEYTHTNVPAGGSVADAAEPDPRMQSQFAPGYDGTIEGFGGQGVDRGTVVQLTIQRDALFPPGAEGEVGVVSEGTALGGFSNTAQIVYGADLLAQAGVVAGDRLTGLAFRVDESFAAPVWSVADYQIRLAMSLNPPGALDPNFLNNRGADYTVVRAGPLSYDGTEYPTGGAPNDFGEFITFQTPYIYGGGDLLLEYTHTNVPAGGSFADAIEPDARMQSQFAPGYDGTMEGFGGQGTDRGTVVKLKLERAQRYATDGNGVDLTGFDDLYDGSPGSMASVTLDVPGCFEITDVDVIVDIAHTWAGDLVVKLESPEGTVVDLWSRPGFDEPADDGAGCCGIAADLALGNTYEIDDAAAASSETMGSGGDDPIDSFVLHSSGFMNERALTTLNGEASGGTWTLYVGDAAAGDSGTLDGFTLQIAGAACDPDHGDVTGDGCVSFADIVAILGVYGMVMDCPGGPGDANCDGIVSFADILLVLGTWGNGCP